MHTTTLPAHAHPASGWGVSAPTHEQCSLTAICFQHGVWPTEVCHCYGPTWLPHRCSSADLARGADIAMWLIYQGPLQPSSSYDCLECMCQATGHFARASLGIHTITLSTVSLPHMHIEWSCVQMQPAVAWHHPDKHLAQALAWSPSLSLICNLKT